jgi:hypothetical protein
LFLCPPLAEKVLSYWWNFLFLYPPLAIKSLPWIACLQVLLCAFTVQLFGESSFYAGSTTFFYIYFYIFYFLQHGGDSGDLFFAILCSAKMPLN